MKTLLVPLISLGFLLSSSLSAQPGADKKLRDPEKKLTAEQKQLLEEHVDLQFRWGVRYSTRKGLFRTLPEVRKDVMAKLDAMPAEEAKKFWRELPRKIKEGFRYLDPLHVLAEERKAAERLPAEAKAETMKLLDADLNKVLAARKKILSYGLACRALVVDQLSTLAANSPKRHRHLDVLYKLDFQEEDERRTRIIEGALAKATKLEKACDNPASTIALVVARGVCDFGNREDPSCHMYHYNFSQRNYNYNAGGCALGFGNGQGNPIQVNFVGGQANRLCSLGPVKYADIKRVPGPEAKLEGSDTGTAVVGHTYLLHVCEQRDKTDFTVKFRVLDLSDDEWIIIEWQRIPQED